MTEEWDQIQGKWDLVRVSGGDRVIRVRVTGVLLYQHQNKITFKKKLLTSMAREVHLTSLITMMDFNKTKTKFDETSDDRNRIKLETKTPIANAN